MFNTITSNVMNTKPAKLRAEPHNLIGTIIGRDAGIIVEKWARRAMDEQPSAKRVHHDVLLDHLPTFLWELGKGLADSGPADSFRHCRPAGLHGDQRWETGWSIEEVIRDYQLIRIIVIEHLHETVERPLTPHEVMALGVYIDDAISSSVTAFLASSNAGGIPEKGRTIADNRSEELLSVLGVLGHELRNPLAPLGNALQVLKLSGNEPTVVERARLLMERQHRVLTRLVNDLLDLPRITQGKMRIRSERLDLCALVREVVEDRRGAFDEVGVRLKLELPAESIHTTGDALRLTQVVGNLLGNAVKFTDRGGEVVVGLSRQHTRPTALLSVRDTGIGIDATVLPKIFEAFVQAERGFERSRGGLGLGLALVKGIVELHGGAVSVKSQGAGMGSEFVIELPLIDIPQDAAASETNLANVETATPPSTAKRILLIEDNQDSAESLKEYLELLGHRVAIANSGPEGVQLAAANPPEIVVCDIGLPGMNGHAVCSELKRIPSLSQTTVIALTGHPSEPQGSQVQGDFDLYLLKPVDPSRLAELIQQHSRVEN